MKKRKLLAEEGVQQITSFFPAKVKKAKCEEQIDEITEVTDESELEARANRFYNPLPRYPVEHSLSRKLYVKCPRSYPQGTEQSIALSRMQGKLNTTSRQDIRFRLLDSWQNAGRVRYRSLSHVVDVKFNGEGNLLGALVRRGDLRVYDFQRYLDTEEQYLNGQHQYGLESWNSSNRVPDFQLIERDVVTTTDLLNVTSTVDYDDGNSEENTSCAITRRRAFLLHHRKFPPALVTLKVGAETSSFVWTAHAFSSPLLACGLLGCAEVRIYDPELTCSGQKAKHTFSWGLGSVLDLASTYEGLMYCGLRDGSVRRLDVRDGKSGRSRGSSKLISSGGAIRGVDVTRDGHVLACGSENGIVQLWDVRYAARSLRQFKFGLGIVALSFSRDPTYLAIQDSALRPALLNCVSGAIEFAEKADRPHPLPPSRCRVVWDNHQETLWAAGGSNLDQWGHLGAYQNKGGTLLYRNSVQLQTEQKITSLAHHPSRRLLVYGTMRNEVAVLAETS